MPSLTPPPPPRPTPPFSVLVITFVAVLGHGQLLAGMPISRWSLPVAAALALLLRRPQLPRFDGWLPTAIAAAGFLAIAYGSLATMDRSWDGFATWSLTARHLTAGATLDHPYFANPAVYQAARGYPLLQPMLLQQASLWLGAQGGRILFPVLWLLLLMAVRAPLSALGVPGRVRTLAIAGLGLVPVFTEPGHGSAESGFAELLVALLSTHAAAAILLRQPALALCIGLCLPLAKHEGTLHLLLLVPVATLAGAGRTSLALAIGSAVALLGWIPMQTRLGMRTQPGPWLAIAAASLPLAAFVWGAALRSCRSHRIAVLCILLAPLLPFAVAPWLPAAMAELPARWIAGSPTWAAVGKVALALGEQLIWMRRVGLTFVLVLGAAWFLYRRRHQHRTTWALTAPLFAYLASWWLLVGLFLLTLPSEDLPLFLKEGTGRYLSQVVGIAWLTVGTSLGAPTQRSVSTSGLEEH